MSTIIYMTEPGFVDKMPKNQPHTAKPFGLFILKKNKYLSPFQNILIFSFPHDN